jgi:hypothetical protein
MPADLTDADLDAIAKLLRETIAAGKRCDHLALSVKAIDRVFGRRWDQIEFDEGLVLVFYDDFVRNRVCCDGRILAESGFLAELFDAEFSKKPCGVMNCSNTRPSTL